MTSQWSASPDLFVGVEHITRTVPVSLATVDNIQAVDSWHNEYPLVGAVFHHDSVFLADRCREKRVPTLVCHLHIATLGNDSYRHQSAAGLCRIRSCASGDNGQ